MTPLILFFAVLFYAAVVIWLSRTSRKLPRANATLTNVNLSEGSGIPAVGTILSVGNNGSPLIYNPIGNQAKIGTNVKTDSADTTNQGSQWDQSIPTLLVGGEISVELFFDPNTAGADGTTGIVGHSATSPGAIFDMFYNQQIRPWKLTWPDGTGQYFMAYITDVPVASDPTGKALTVAMKLKITGAIQPF